MGERMIELLKIHALVRAARLLVFTGTAADFVRKVARRSAIALANDATARMDAPDAAWRRGRTK
jgi:hypothetical protein